MSRNSDSRGLKKASSLLESERQPLNVHFNFYRHPRLGPAVYEVSIIGPFEASGPGDTASRQRIFVSQPTGPGDEEACAKRIVGTIARRAYRRAVNDDDLQALMKLIAAGEMRPVIDEVLPLEQAREGLRLIQDREVIGKVVVAP